jgi:hypothetical protein
VKKFFALTAIFALVLAACEQPSDNGNPDNKLPSLTVRNQSSFVLTDVKFSNISFYVQGSSDLPVSGQSVKQLTVDEVGKPYYIIFKRKDIGIICRTEESKAFIESGTWTLTDETMIVELANTGNKKSLGQIDFLPRLTVERGGFTVPRNETVNLEETVVGYPRQNEFTLKNSGVGKLTLSGTEPVKVSGATGVFSAVQPAVKEILSNESLTFKINFSPEAVQPYPATVVISSDDPSGDYTFTITAVGVPPKPIASVFFEDAEISQNGTVNLGEVLITLSKTITITLKNSGQLLLMVDTANITITGADAVAFTRLTNPGGNISAGGQSSFLIEYKPVNQGENNAVLTIPTNDDSRNPIFVYLQGTAVKGSAVLELSHDDTVIPDNSLTPFDFDRVELGTNTTRAFSIKNTGNIALELIGDPAVESSNPVFTVTTQPADKTINPNLTTTFIIRYIPTDELENTGSIVITYNENTLFTLTVKGTGYVKRPQITVKQGNIAINQYGEYNFGRVAIDEPKDISFTIGNSGDASLTFVTVNNNRINLAENSEGFFTVTQQPSSSTIVMPGSSATFTVRFNPVTEANGFTATVLIETNSRTDSEFRFTVKADSYIKRPQITVRQGTTTINSPSEFNFGSVFAGENGAITFTIRNSGEADLNIIPIGSMGINLTNNTAGIFSVTQQPSSAVIIPGGSTTFVIRFSPAAIGEYSATVQIKTNSHTNDEFSFTIKGTGRRYYIIGDTGPAGGIVFYDAGSVINGWRYLEASLNDFTAQWGADAYYTVATGENIGDGKQNTQRIVAARGGTYAAQICTNLDINGFKDWFLPSREELNQLYLRRTIVSNFGTDYYWSSSSYSDYSAWGQDFSDGTQGRSRRTNTHSFRAIRSF